MRTLTTAQDETLAQAHTSVHLKIEIKPTSGSWTDMTTLEGYNWVRGFTYGHNMDNYVADGEALLWKRRGDLSLSPLMTNSKLHDGGVLTRPGAEIRVSTAVLAEDAVPESDDYVVVFRGYIDDSEWSGDEVKLRCRDLGADLDEMIESEKIYPKDPNTELDIEDVMQEILDDNTSITLYSITGTAGTPFQSADSPGWIIKQWIQKKQTIQQALKVLIDQLGWQLHYKYNDSTSDFELTAYLPNREVRARGTLTMDGQPSATQGVTVDATTVSEPGDWAIGDTVYKTAQNIASAITDNVSGASADAVPAEPAIGTITFTGQPSALDSFVINSTTFTEGTDWSVGSSLDDTLGSIVNAINDSDESDNVIAWVRDSTAVKVAWQVNGTVGNSKTFTESLANATADGSGTLGGSQEGKNVRVLVEWDTPGTAGNAKVFTETLSNATADGGGTLGGTRAGVDLSVDRTFGPSQYYSLSNARVSRLNIRAKVKVVYGLVDTEEQNLNTPTPRPSITVEDTASQTKYNKTGYFELAEAGNSQIDTAFEARTLATSILDDLKEPTMQISVDMPYFWPVEISDYYTFQKDGINHDADQNLAVTGYRHQLSADGNANTVMQLQGKPSSAKRRWLRLEARGGVADQNRDFIYDPPRRAEYTPGMSSFEVKVENPRTLHPPMEDWAYTRVYYDTSSGFTAGPDTLKAVAAALDKFSVTGLTPGGTYYVRLAFEDSNGNVSNLTPEQEVITQKSAPYHHDEDEYKKSLIPNSDFRVATLRDATLPPDRWTMDTGAWLTDMTVDSSIHQTGNRSLEITPGVVTIPQINSDIVPIDTDSVIKVSFAYYFTGTAGTGSSVEVRVKRYDKDKSAISGSFNVVASLDGKSASTWYQHSELHHLSNTSTRHIQAQVLSTDGDSGSSNLVTYVDRVEIIPAPRQFKVSGTDTGIPASTWVTAAIGTEDYDYGSVFDGSPGYDFSVTRGGTFQFAAMVEFSSLNSSKYCALRFKVLDPSGTTYYTSSYGIEISGVARATNALILELPEGGTVEAQVWHNDSTNRDITDYYFSGMELQP
jgi:hypothetical protein